MSRYEFFKFMHVSSAIVWLGAGVGLIYLWRRLIKSGNLQVLRAIDAQNSALGKFIFGPASLLTLGFGIAMVIDAPAWGFGDLWIIIGLVGFALSGAIEGAWAGPAGKRFLALANEQGLQAPVVETARRKVALAGNAEMLVLFVVVWAMVAKPMG